MDYLEVVYIRLKNNPKVSRKIKGRFWADMQLIQLFETEKDLKYHIAVMLEVLDGFKSIIDRKKANRDMPKMKVLDELHKQETITRIALPPECHSELDAKKILLQVNKVMGFGAMPDG